MKIELMHSVDHGYYQPLSAASVTRSGEVKACMATYSLLLQIINGRLPTGSTYFNDDGG